MTQDCINDSARESSFLTTVEKYGDWELHYPESLLEIWDIWHNPKLFSQSESLHSLLDRQTNISWESAPKEDVELEFKGKLTFGDYLGKRFHMLETIMVSKCRSRYFEDDLIRDELAEIFNEWSREKMEAYSNKKGESCLASTIRKNIAQKQNPSGYNFDQKLRNALRELVQKKKAEMREKESNRIYSSTHFKYAGAPEASGSYSNYEMRKDEIPMYKPRQSRNNSSDSVDNTDNGRDETLTDDSLRKDKKDVSIISPKDAEDLVERILILFDGWNPYRDIKQAAWNHVQHTEKFVPLDKVDFSKEIADEPFEVPLFDDAIIEKINQEVLSKRHEDIWNEICKKTSERFFCLYILPEDFPYTLNLPKGNNIWKAADFGKTSTMSDQRSKVKDIIKKETIIKTRGNKDFSSEEIGEIVKDIFDYLNHRCIDSGYDPASSISKSEQE